MKRTAAQLSSHEEPPAKRLRLNASEPITPFDEQLDEDVDVDELLELLEESEQIEAENNKKPPPSLDEATLTSRLQILGRAMQKNRLQRNKFQDQPQKFLDSELELEKAVNGLSALSASPELYNIFLTLNGLDYLFELLQHENLDIVSNVISLLSELTEIEIHGQYDDLWMLPNCFVHASTNGVQLLFDNMKRLDESRQEDQQTVFAILQILENLIDCDPKLAVTIVEKSKFFSTLLKRANLNLKRNSNTFRVDENTLYVSELLDIYLQNAVMSPDGGRIFKSFSEVKGLDKVLSMLNPYATRDPEGAEEKEFVQNLLSVLASSVFGSKSIKKSFSDHDAAKLDFVLKLVRSQKFVRQGALRVLDTALDEQGLNCIAFVRKGGLKVLFNQFMKTKVKNRYKGEHSQDQAEMHVACILVSLFRHCADVELRRLMKKFVERDFEKLKRLVTLHAKYFERLEDADRAENERRQANNMSDETLQEKRDRQLGLGLTTLRHVDIVMAFTCTFGETAIKTQCESLLLPMDQDFDDVKGILKDFVQESLEETEENDAGSEIDPDSLVGIVSKLLELL